jgi:transcription antitermination factor NusG
MLETTLSDCQICQRWYAVYVRPRHEKCVALQLRLKTIEHFLPTYEEVRKWKNGCRMQVELPLFPGYVFTRIPLSQRLRVLTCPGVIRFVGFNQDLTPIEDHEVESLRLGLKTNLARPHPYLTVGTKVRVRRGPFEDRIGILMRHERRFRVIISMDLLKRAIAVEMDLADVDVVLPPSVPPQEEYCERRSGGVEPYDPGRMEFVECASQGPGPAE